MYPYIDLGFIELPTYLVIFSIGYILMSIYARKIGTEYGYDKKDMLGVSVYAAVGLFVGAKLLYFVTVIPSAIKDIEELRIMIELSPIRAIDYLFGGLVYYGGFIGAAVGIYIYCKKHFLLWVPMTDIYAPLVPFVHGCGRIGCFMAGCCYGIEYNGIGAVCFPGQDICRFPVQLVEAVINFTLALILELERRKKVTKSGQLVGIYMMSYGIVRFILEFLRGDEGRGAIGILSTSQIISIILIPIGIMLVKGKMSNNTGKMECEK